MKEEVMLHQEGTSDFKKEAGCFGKKKLNQKAFSVYTKICT